MNFEDLKLGMKESVTKTITETDIVLYSGISLDINPVHLNEEFAKTTIFKGRIAHGMLTAGFISAVLGTKLPGEGTIYLTQNIKFTSPVRAGDTITAQCEVIELNSDKKIVTLKTICFNQNNIIVLNGEAKVLKN